MGAPNELPGGLSSDLQAKRTTPGTTSSHAFFIVEPRSWSLVPRPRRRHVACLIRGRTLQPGGKTESGSGEQTQSSGLLLQETAVGFRWDARERLAIKLKLHHASGTWVILDAISIAATRGFYANWNRVIAAHWRHANFTRAAIHIGGASLETLIPPRGVWDRPDLLLCQNAPLPIRARFPLTPTIIRVRTVDAVTQPGRLFLLAIFRAFDCLGRHVYFTILNFIDQYRSLCRHIGRAIPHRFTARSVGTAGCSLPGSSRTG